MSLRDLLGKARLLPRQGPRSPNGVLTHNTPSVIPEKLNGDPLTSGASSRDLRSGTYTAIRFVHQNNAMAHGGPVRRYEHSGDHVFVESIRSAHPIAIRLGVPTNPWMRIREGDVIRRTFSQLALRVVAPTSQAVSGFESYSEARLLISTGPLLEQRLPKEYGLRHGWYGVDQVTVDTNIRSVTERIFANLPGTPDDKLSFGRGGGTIAVRNRSLAATVFAYDKTVRDPGFDPSNAIFEGWPIEAGETHIFKLEEQAEFGTIGTSTTDPLGKFFLFTRSGTAKVALLISSLEADLGDYFQRTQLIPPLA